MPSKLASHFLQPYLPLPAHKIRTSARLLGTRQLTQLPEWKSATFKWGHVHKNSQFHLALEIELEWWTRAQWGLRAHMPLLTSEGSLLGQCWMTGLLQTNYRVDLFLINLLFARCRFHKEKTAKKTSAPQKSNKERDSSVFHGEKNKGNSKSKAQHRQSITNLIAFSNFQSQKIWMREVQLGYLT